MYCLSFFNPSRPLISSFNIILFFSSRSLSFFLFSFSFFSFLFIPSSLSFSFFFQIWQQERLQLLQPPTAPLSIPTSLGTLGTANFIEMTWALRRIWSLWITSRRLTFNGLWNGDISQDWSIVAVRTTV